MKRRRVGMENKSRRDVALTVAKAAALSALSTAGAANLTDRQPLALLALWCACAVVAWWAVRRPAEKRLNRVALTLGAVFAVMLVIGREIHQEQTIEALLTWSASIKALFRIVGLTALCWAVLRIVLRWAVRMHATDRCGGPAFWKIWLAILVCWMPYYVFFFPGCLSPDSISELDMILGGAPLSNHHPLIHQWTVAPFVLLGRALGSVAWGVGLYSLFQMMAMSAIFAAVVRRLMAEGAGRGLIAAVLVFYALVSVHAFYSVTMWKDVLFGGITVIAVMMLTRLVMCGEAPASEPFGRKNWVLLAVVLFLFCVYRNNGYYAFLLCFPVFLLCNRRLWKPLLALGAVVLLLVGAYQALIFDVLGAKKSNAGEALALPLQQIAKTVREYNRELSQDEMEALEEIFTSVEEVRWAYSPELSDPVKDLLNNDVLMSNPLRYLKVWAQIGMEHPLVYLDAFLYHTHGYWYPDVPYWAIERKIVSNAYGLQQRGSSVRQLLCDVYDAVERAPVLGALCRPAPYVWAALIAFAALVCKRRARLASPWLLLAGVWLTSMASPVYAEFRYMYGVVACMPLYVGVALTARRRA